MNTQTPELIALCWLDENGENQLADWAMVLPAMEKVIAYVPPRTGVPGWSTRFRRWTLPA